MFLSKKLLLKKVKDYKIDFTAFSSGMNTEIDENLLPIKYAKKFYNFAIKNGSLKTGLGFNFLSLPVSYNTYEKNERLLPTSPNNSAIKGLWHYKYFSHSMGSSRHKIVFYTDEKLLYFTFTISSLSEFWTMFPPFEPEYFEGKIDAINYHLNGLDSLIMVVPQEQKIIVFDSNDDINVIDNAPNLITIGLHYERLFAVLEGDRKTLMFSANLDPTNWNVDEDEGGFIDMRDERGRINKIVSFNDYVYVFRDYGVSRVSAYGDQNDFSVTQLFVSSSKIFGNSVVSCGDRIMFLSRDGLHVFDGYSTVKLKLNIEILLQNENNDNCNAVFFRNKYYLACRMDFDDGLQLGCEGYSEGYQNNTLIEYDIKSGDLNILRGVDILNMISIEESNVSKLAACFNGEFKSYFGQLDESGTLFGNPLKCCWQSPYSNFGHPNKIKIVKEISIKTNSDCCIVVKSDKEEKEYLVKGSPVTQRIKTHVLGELIQISFLSEGSEETLISAPQIVIGVVQWQKKKL